MMKSLPLILVIFVTVYVGLSFAAPTFLRLGMEDVGMSIHSIYRVFCHQRVERSAFLFGEEGLVKFYTREELQQFGAIPEENPNIPEPFNERLFGYPYVGNSVVGYKMPLCMRDVPLYLAFAIFGWLYLWRIRKGGEIKKYRWWLAVLLMIPMAIDGLFQYSTEFLLPGLISEGYYDNIPKRVVTGALFGIGFAMIILPLLADSVRGLMDTESKSSESSDIDV